jgi:ACS family hexuronate transporter-like MFS transporter
MLESRETAPASFHAWGICAVLLLATFLNYMDRQVLAVTLPTLKAEYQLAERRVGLLEGSFGFSFAAGSLFFGWLADRVGPRLLYPAVLTGWSLAGIATSLAGNEAITHWLEGEGSPPGTGVFRWLLGCRILLGFCEAGHWPCALITVGSILAARDRMLGNGILQSGASLGAIVVPLYVEACDRAGRSWEFPFWTIGLAGLTWVPLWFAVTRGSRLRPSTSTARVGSSPSSSEADPDLVRKLIVLAVIVASLTISWQFLRAWLALFLQDHHGYSKQATRGLMSGYFIAADVGCLLSGAFVSAMIRQGWTLRRSREIGFGLFTLLTACGSLVPHVDQPTVMLALLFLTGAGILGLHPFYYALTQELPAARVGFFSGLLAAAGWIVSSLSQILLGRHIEASKSYELGLTIVGWAPALGLIALLWCWPRMSRPPVVSN